MLMVEECFNIAAFGSLRHQCGRIAYQDCTQDIRRGPGTWSLLLRLVRARDLCSSVKATDLEGPTLHTQVAREWLREVAVACRRYRDELLAAVLELLLVAPPAILPAQVTNLDPKARSLIPCTVNCTPAAALQGYVSPCKQCRLGDLGGLHIY